MNRYRWKMILKFLIYALLFFSTSIEFVKSEEIQTKEQITSRFSGRIPQEWGEVVKGVKTRLDTEQKVLALTFDACGGPKGSDYDQKLVQYLENEKISATLFISGRWIDANPKIFEKLAQNRFLEIENHGLNHKPCSAIGRSVYGMRGTRNIAEIFDEIELNALKILSQTGRKPRYYRPSAAYCDEICVKIANALGYEVVNFGARGDAGSTSSKKQVKEVLLNSAPASIILMHMNRPGGETARGLMEAIPELRKRGFRFVKVLDFGLR